MGARPGEKAPIPSVTIDVSEGIDPEDWAPLPSTDRAFVGGRTIWTGPFEPPVIVAQPNRWGVVESGFPETACIVECDPAVTRALPLPPDVVAFVDRSHRPVSPPRLDGAALIARAERLAAMLEQIRGVQVAARPFARTVPLLTPVDATRVIRHLEELGIVGGRKLAGIGGGMALTVHDSHTDTHFQLITEAVASAVAG